jgi:hypothetical protein
MLDVKITTGVDGDYGPAVTGFNPVGRCQPKPAVVAAGNDQLTDAGSISIGQGYLQVGAGRGVGESVAAGSAVQFGNEVAGGASMIESSPLERSSGGGCGVTGSDCQWTQPERWTGGVGGVPPSPTAPDPLQRPASRHPAPTPTLPKR